MIKFIHLSFVLFALVSFVGKFALLQLRPELLQHKTVKIAHHLISGLLILSGVILVFQGGWLSGSIGWLVAKILAVLAFIGFGVFTMKTQSDKRWYGFAATLACFIYIAMVAVKKDAFWFF